MKLTDFYHSRVVLDSSVLAKFFLEEEGTGLVEDFVEMHNTQQLTIMVSPLLFFELGNTFSFKLGRKAACEALRTVKQWGLAVVELMLDEQREVLELTEKHPAVSFYDASYHILAKAFQATLVTADEQYFKQAEKEGDVVLLQELT